jgi:hypothetical protein
VRRLWLIAAAAAGGPLTVNIDGEYVQVARHQPLAPACARCLRCDVPRRLPSALRACVRACLRACLRASVRE